MMISLSMNWWPHQTETEIAYLGKPIRDILQAVSRGCCPRNVIWNDPTCLVALPVYRSVHLNVDDYKTGNKVCIDLKYKREKTAAAVISTRPMTHRNWVR